MKIFEAVKKADLEILERIIKQKTDVVNMVNIHGRTPIHYAALNGDLEVVKLLLKYNANVNPDDNGGYSPLYYAATYGHLEVVKHIVNQGANVNQINNRGNSPMHDALLKGHVSVVLHLPS